MKTLLSLYEQELSSLRNEAAQFAREYPKVAGRLRMEEAGASGDPDVERLMEGFAFLAARIRLELQDQPARLAQHVLEMVYPEYLAPTPSMTVVQLTPSREHASMLAHGVRVPRQSSLITEVDWDGSRRCEFRTSQDVVLWPVRIRDATYEAVLSERDVAFHAARGVRAALRIRLTTEGGLTFDKMSLDALPLFISGEHGPAVRLYEQLVARCVTIAVTPGSEPASWREVIDPSTLSPLGFDDDQALLPCGPRTSKAHRLLREFFALPERFLFLRLRGLGPAVSRCVGSELDVTFYFDAHDNQVSQLVDRDTLRLFCTPAVNLFPQVAEPIVASDLQTDYLVVPDRSRPRDHEVHSVTGVMGIGQHAEASRRFRPLDAAFGAHESGAYFSIQRRPRPLALEERTRGVRSSYRGEDVFLSIVDRSAASGSAEIQSLIVETLCTNSDLPLLMRLGSGQTDFRIDDPAEAVESVRMLSAPRHPRPSLAADDKIWPLIKHLSVNHLSLVGAGAEQDGSVLRELLDLHAEPDDVLSRIQINALREVSSWRTIRAIPGLGPMVFGQGLEVSLTFDDEAVGAFLLGSVLERVFARFVSMNSFCQTSLRTRARGEVMRWPPRTGTRATV